MKVLRLISISVLLAGAVFGQSDAPAPKFEVADIHLSAPSPRPFVAGPFLHGGRYEIRMATMNDLVRIAWDVDPDKVTGGPIWVEFDRFDVIAKVSPGTKSEELKPMLRSLLAERFKLKVHSDTKPFASYSLTTTANPKLKQADGSGTQTGCTMGFKAPPQLPGQTEMSSLTMTSSCHNATVAGFADNLRNLMITVRAFGGAQNPTNIPVTDDTGLEGIWNFDFNLTMPTNNSGGNAEATAIDAIEKQLGLKMTAKTVSMPVISIDTAEQKPTPNSADVAKLLPTPPTEFDVVEFKPSAPGSAPSGAVMVNGGMVMAVRADGRGGPPPFQNDRVNLQNYTLRQLINLGWNLTSNDQIFDAPKWIDTEHFDLIAKAPAGTGTVATSPGGRAPVDTDVFRPMIRAALQDKFKMAVHFEDKPGTAYVLSAIKPKLQKASDPTSHTKYVNGPGPDGKDPRKANPALSRLVYCQNMTMAEFASLLPIIGLGYVTGAVQDTTGLEDRYDFTLNFSLAPPPNGMMAVRMSSDAGGGSPNGPSDPSGGLSLIDAIAKQLGLKLEAQKKPAPVMVIDHLETKPVDN
jgi:uncharacterized protein (TIGR03435 family)